MLSGMIPGKICSWDAVVIGGILPGQNQLQSPFVSVRFSGVFRLLLIRFEHFFLKIYGKSSIIACGFLQKHKVLSAVFESTTRIFWKNNVYYSDTRGEGRKLNQSHLVPDSSGDYKPNLMKVGAVRRTKGNQSHDDGKEEF